MPRFVAEGNVLDLVVSGSAVSSGDLMQIAGLAGIVVSDAEVGEKVGVQIRGLVAVPKAGATTFSAGDTVEYDEGNDLAVASGDYQLGIAAYDAGNGPTEVIVLLNAQGDDEGDDEGDEGDEGDDDDDEGDDDDDEGDEDDDEGDDDDDEGDDDDDEGDDDDDEGDDDDDEGDDDDDEGDDDDDEGDDDEGDDDDDEGDMTE